MSGSTQYDHATSHVIFDPGEHLVVEPKPPDLTSVFQCVGTPPAAAAAAAYNLVSDGALPSPAPQSPTDPYPSSPTSPLLAPFLNVHPLSLASSSSSENAGQQATRLQEPIDGSSQSTRTNAKESAEGSGSNVNSVVPPISRVRNYIVLGDVSVPGPAILPAVDTVTGLRQTCKVIAKRDYPESLRANYIMDSSDYIMNIEEVVISSNNVFAFFKRGECDLQSFMQKKRLLKEDEVRHIFHQVVSAVDECHQNGIIVKDLKMKKIIITDSKRLSVRLESLDGAKILEDVDDDGMTERLGCPAYVAPELLRSAPERYSGRAADMWSIGIILYALLVGRYPFYDKEPMRMLAKINRGRFHIPHTRGISWLARSVINSLLVSEPARRMTAADVLCHPWFREYDASKGSHSHGGSLGATAARVERFSREPPPAQSPPTLVAPTSGHALPSAAPTTAHPLPPVTTTRHKACTDHVVPDFTDDDGAMFS